ncbi:hypothetical protein RI845_10825 [Thalassotalea nanhaiensis]|uniref:Uncharacterized protein n=1 Tax=Thalassotalea nanhaiensis TaxID=3065648 RepID=A0ABY9TDY4_9GAMM|nr:hypothetical protein RI845_10825 [Colwelliaceae bacterium SQ345]
MKFKLTAAALALSVALPAVAADLIEFTAGEAAVAADVNSNFTAVAADAMAAQTSADEATAAAATNATAITANTEAATANAEAISANADAITANTAATATNATAAADNTAALTAAKEALEASIGANSATVTANTASIEALQMSSVSKMELVDANDTVVGTIVAINETTYTAVIDGIVVKSSFAEQKVGQDDQYNNINSVKVEGITTGSTTAEVYFTEAACAGDSYISPSKFGYMSNTMAAYGDKIISAAFTFQASGADAEQKAALAGDALVISKGLPVDDVAYASKMKWDRWGTGLIECQEIAGTKSGLFKADLLASTDTMFEWVPGIEPEGCVGICGAAVTTQMDAHVKIDLSEYTLPLSIK